jgi:hypothetical protein
MWAGLCLLLVAGCNGAEPKAAQAPVGPPKVDPPAMSATPPPLGQVVPPSAAEPCDKASLAYLIGKPRSLIPVPVDPSLRRVACTTCPVTEDYHPNRTNILFDAQTGLVTTLKCG